MKLHKNLVQFHFRTWRNFVARYEIERISKLDYKSLPDLESQLAPPLVRGGQTV